MTHYNIKKQKRSRDKILGNSPRTIRSEVNKGSMSNLFDRKRSRSSFDLTLSLGEGRGEAITRRHYKHDLLLTFMDHATARNHPAPVKPGILETLFSLFV